MSKLRGLSWEPVRKGETFCSPGCGHGCTYAEYLKASQKAELLAKRLGKGWVCSVSENLGWHFKATKNGCDVHQTGGRSFWASLVFADKQFCSVATTPGRAVDFAWNEARIFSIRLNRDLEEFVK